MHAIDVHVCVVDWFVFFRAAAVAAHAASAVIETTCTPDEGVAGTVASSRSGRQGGFL